MPYFTVRGPVALPAAAPSGSVWGDHGTNVSLSTTSAANDTATGLANSFSSVRGTQAHSSTGKYYFEVKILAVPAVANLVVGIMDNTTANGAAMDNYSLLNSVGHTMFNGNSTSNGWSGTHLGASWSLSTNDVMGVAVDFDAVATDNGFSYLHLNNTYFLSGNPTSGSSGTGAVGNGGFPGARPMLSLWGVTANSGVIQLITSAAALTYLPSGYTAWG